MRDLNVHPRVMAILKEEADRETMTLDDLFGGRRYSAMVRARHLAWKRLHDDLGWSLIRIAELFDCDHSTVLHALQNLNGGVKTSPARRA